MQRQQAARPGQEKTRSVSCPSPALSATPWAVAPTRLTGSPSSIHSQASTPMSSYPRGTPLRMWAVGKEKSDPLQKGKGLHGTPPTPSLHWPDQNEDIKHSPAPAWKKTDPMGSREELEKKCKPSQVAPVCILQPGMASLGRLCQGQAPPQSKPPQVRLWAGSKAS